MKLLFVPVKFLKPIQSEVNRKKIENFKQNPDKLANPIIVSKGGYILDGHHRFLAAKELDPNTRIPALVARCGIKQLIELGHEFDGSFTRTVYESTTYIECVDDSDENSTELLVRKTLKWTENSQISGEIENNG
jgi:hypothetical protein